MDRLKEKLRQASGVAARQTAKIEAEADKLIAREGEIEQRTKAAFAPHHAALDNQKRELDSLEDALQVISNAPLEDGSEKELTSNQ